MRMWMVPPRFLCRNHLLGEHRELHALAGIVARGTRLDGYITNGLIDTGRIVIRHKQLVAEMISRGYNHNSPLDHLDGAAQGRVDEEKNINELHQRCAACRERIANATPPDR